MEEYCTSCMERLSDPPAGGPAALRCMKPLTHDRPEGQVWVGLHGPDGYHFELRGTGARI